MPKRRTQVIERLKHEIEKAKISLVQKNFKRLCQKLMVRNLRKVAKFYHDQTSKSKSAPKNVVHLHYICDGCDIGPIKGICYTCPTCKDFDFCEKCEATIPHPHAFLKLKTPEQRPHTIFFLHNKKWMLKAKDEIIGGKSKGPKLGQTSTPTDFK